MWYTKEREFIVGYTTEGHQYVGKFNILTGEYVGKTGKVMIRMPAGFSGRYDGWRNKNYMSDEQAALSDFYADWYNILQILPRFFPQLTQETKTEYTNRLNFYRANAEKLISLLLKPYDVCTDLQNKHLILTKTAVKFMHEYLQAQYDSKLINSDFVELIGWIDDQGFQKDDEIKRDIKAYYRKTPSSQQLSISLLKLFIERANSEKLYYYSFEEEPISFILYHYTQMCKDMYNKIEIPHNILTNYVITRALYEDWLKIAKDKELAKYNDLTALYYENDTYKIFPLLTVNDFHDEATQQENCVERIYLQKVMDSITHIVVVRKKDNPLKSFITCEVTNKGIINQFLLSHNRDITENAELKALKSEYQSHLKDNWTIK